MVYAKYPPYIYMPKKKSKAKIIKAKSKNGQNSYKKTKNRREWRNFTLSTKS